MIHCISYVLLVQWYLSFSPTSLMKEFTPVPIAKMPVEEKYVIYYLSLDGRAVMRSDLHGGDVEKIAKVNATHPWDRLFAKTDATGKFDLMLCGKAQRGVRIEKKWC